LGGISGGIQVLFFISAFLLFLNIFNYPSEEDKKSSLLYHDVYIIVPSIVEYIVGSDKDKREFLKDLINKKDADSLDIQNYIDKK
jgi:hypothetical protein